MDADVEDGELIESDDENSKTNCKNAEMPLKLGFSVSNVWHGVPVSGGGCELGYMETLTNSIVKSRRIPEGLPTSESENSDDESECSDDERPNKKSCGSYEFARPVAVGSGTSLDSSNARSGARKSHKNNIWSTVIQDQILSNDLMGWSGLEQAFESDRNVESYNYIKAKESIQSTPIPLSCPQETEVGAQSDLVPDLSEMETFGTVSSKKTAESADKSTENKNCGPGRPWLKRGHNGNPRGSVHSRLGTRGSEESYDFNHIKVTSSDEPSAVTDELMRILREPDSMKDTFGRIVETIGVEGALKFLHETADMEKTGGLMTKDGHRRRTPGGVYLYLVKNGVTKDQNDVIFQNQREDIKQNKKLWKMKQKRMLEKSRQTMEMALGISVSEAAGDAVSPAVASTVVDEVVKTDKPLKMEEEDGLDLFDPSVSIELG